MSGFKLDVVAQHIGRVVACGPGDGGTQRVQVCSVRLNVVHCQPLSLCFCFQEASEQVSFPQPHLQTLQHVLEACFCPWHSITQPKLVSSDTLHHSLHVVPEPLLRLWYLEIGLSSPQIPSLLNNCYPDCCCDLFYHCWLCSSQVLFVCWLVNTSFINSLFKVAWKI